MCDTESRTVLEPEEDLMSDNSGFTPYILIGRDDAKTKCARKMLKEAGLRHRFAYADISEGPLPQLLTGLNVFIGLEQISRLAARARRNHQVAEE